MTEKKSRGQPKFEPTQDQRNQVKLMKALGIPEDRICKTITNPRTRKPVAPMTLARAFATELETGATEFHTFVSWGVFSATIALSVVADSVNIICVIIQRSVRIMFEVIIIPGLG